jgi:hypothetical protein
MRSLPGVANPTHIAPGYRRAFERGSHILVRHRPFTRNHDVGKLHHSAVAQKVEQPRRAREKLRGVRQHFPRIAADEFAAAVAQIAFALPRDRGVDRHDERGETRGARSRYRRRCGFAAAQEIELIPSRSARRRAHIFEPAAGERR